MPCRRLDTSSRESANKTLRALSTASVPPATFEQLLREIAALAAGRLAEARLLHPSDFERWEGGGSSYLEADLSAAADDDPDSFPDIDLSTRDGRVMIRIASQSPDDAPVGSGSGRGGHNVRSPG
jgi:hypothetical protein